MIDLFSLEAVNRSGAVFDTKKLDWVNQQYLQAKPSDALAESLKPYLAEINVDTSAGPALSDVANLLRDRASTLVDMASAAQYFYVAPTSYDEKAAKKQFKVASVDVLSAVAKGFGTLQEWQAEPIQALLDQTVSDLDIGFGKLGQPLRLAVTGGTASPSLADTLALIGKDEVVARVEKAIALCV